MNLECQATSWNESMTLLDNLFEQNMNKVTHAGSSVTTIMNQAAGPHDTNHFASWRNICDTARVDSILYLPPPPAPLPVTHNSSDIHSKASVVVIACAQFMLGIIHTYYGYGRRRLRLWICLYTLFLYINHTYWHFCRCIHYIYNI